MKSYSTEAVVINHINDLSHQIKSLPKGTTIRTEHLFERDVWLGSTKGFRLRLGRILAELVRQNRLPLVAAGKASNNHMQYIVI